MSWHDSQRFSEPASETALREELRGLLGWEARNYFESEPTPELVALAEDLRREARRRNHTARNRSHWMLLAAAVPLALAFGGVSLWGIKQKHRAEDLAAAVVQREVEIARMASSQKAPAIPATTPQKPETLLASAAKPASKSPKPKQLVIQLDQPTRQVVSDTQQVKAH
jgi:hypothetical protein